jgi:hypothetical protein
MDFGRITDPNAWKQAMAGLLRRGGEVTDYIATAPEKAGEAILQGHERNKALQAQAFANPDRPFQVTNQQAMGELGDRMLAGPLSVAPVGMIAYHGTPHLIKDKFDISKVGTGEGAQAYGHGMYFAENPAIAESYKKSTSFTKYKDKATGEIVDVTTLPKEKLADLSKNYTEYTGNLYKVDIPDEQIPKMLDWDKPLNQQPKDVQDALAKYDPDLYSPKGADYDSAELGQHIYQRLIQNNVQKFGHGGNQKRASEDLNALGIKGIRYYDEGSRKAGGTSNFVVFDPSDVKILEQNSQPLSRKELLQDQIDKLTN